VTFFRQGNVLDCLIHVLLSLFARHFAVDSFQSREEFNRLTNRQQIEKAVLLWTDTDVFAYFLHLAQDVPTSDRGVSARRWDRSRKQFDGRSLSRA